jgi:FkbH-like protein
MKKDEYKAKDIKCVVWDLDNTLWDGVLLESDNVRLKSGIRETIQILDSRGILHSIASKGSFDDAMNKLNQFELAEYFLYPEIHWNAKSVSISRIQENLNLGLDTLLFIDDQPFERDEVQHVHPEILCLDASEYTSLLHHQRLNPKFITEDSSKRRKMYLDDMKRKKEEDEFAGPKKEFLESLNMTFIISEAQEEDLKRSEELTQRTNQLNTTGISYSIEDLKAFIRSERHKLLIGELTDKYGSYGKISLALLKLNEKHWDLKLFLMSCRVMARGVGSVLLSHIMLKTKNAGKILHADFKHTDRNRMMFITFKFANFKTLQSGEDGNMLLTNDLSFIQQIPSYIKVIDPREW